MDSKVEGDSSTSVGMTHCGWGDENYAGDDRPYLQ